MIPMQDGLRDWKPGQSARYAWFVTLLSCSVLAGIVVLLRSIPNRNEEPPVRSPQLESIRQFQVAHSCWLALGPDSRVLMSEPDGPLSIWDFSSGRLQT